MDTSNKENSSRNNFYSVPETPELKALFSEADRLKQKIDYHRPLRSDIWSTIQEKIRIQWTTDSNAIEGSTLTFGDTYHFLREGITVHGKPFKDFLSAKNHAEAIDYLNEIIKENRPVSEGLIKEINALLLTGVSYTEAMNQYGERIRKPANSGQYKKLPNHVLCTDSSIHYYTEPIHVQDEMEYLCKWINEKINTIHPVITSALAHSNMVRIHPFDDGNGRGARLLMNFILIKKGYLPAIIQSKDRSYYIECLEKSDKGNLTPFIEFIGNSLLSTQQMIIRDLENRQKLH